MVTGCFSYAEARCDEIVSVRDAAAGLNFGVCTRLECMLAAAEVIVAGVIGRFVSLFAVAEEEVVCCCCCGDKLSR